MTKIKMRPVQRSFCDNYLQKSEELFDTAKWSFENKKWNACAIISIHTVISASDALCVYFLGFRASGNRHEDAAELLKSIPVEKESLRTNLRRFGKILNIKNEAEYEERLIREGEAQTMLNDTKRFFEFAKNKLSEIDGADYLLKN